MVTHDNYELLKAHVEGDLLLLGSQTMNLPDAQGVQATAYFKEVRPIPGVRDVFDIDNNGEADSPASLSQYNKDLFGHAPTWHTIADFGTLEHVGGIANALRNVFAWLDVGGKAIHVNPSVDYIDEAHKGLPRFTTEFWEAYAKLTNMNIVLLDYKPAYAESEAIECRVILEKAKDSKAPTKAKIESLIKKHLK